MTFRRALRTAGPYTVPLLVLAGTWVTMLAIVPGFGGQSAVYGVLEQFALVGLLALGVAVTMVCGELDLSVVAVMDLAGVIAVRLANDSGVILAIVGAVVISAAFGLLQGYLIARLRINSLMFTIGTLLMLGGVAYLVTNSQPVLINKLSITNPFIARHGIFSLSSLIALGVFASVGAFLAFVRAGRDLYAVGGGRSEAEAAGVSSVRAISLAFGLSAGCAGLAGALAAMRSGSAAPGDFADLLLPAVAAAVVGGISLSGGRGTIINVAAGVAILGTISSGLAVNGSPDSVNQLAQGALLLALLALEFVAIRFSASQGRSGLQRVLRGLGPP